MTKKTPKKATGPFAALDGMREKIAAKQEPAAKRPPPPPRPPRGDRAADPGVDDLSFHRLMSGVVPLDKKNDRVPRTSARAESGLEERKQRAEALQRDEDRGVAEKLRALVDEPVRFEVTDDGAYAEGRRPEVDRALLRQLRHGGFPVDARLDLRGATVRDAEERLGVFLAGQRSHGERCVLVVHGKGEPAPGGRGVLRGEMSAWLSQGAARQHVAAFATARGPDGEPGATYVLLAR